MSELEKTLRRAIPSQLASAIDETPGLIVPVLTSFAVLEGIPRSGTILDAVPPVSFHLLAGCLAGLLGVIVYSFGDYWDKKWFDPRYGLEGTWTTRAPPLFPSAASMVEVRQEAAKKLLTGDAQKTQKGVYAAAEELVRARGRWDEVLGAVVISKFVRSFIWPSFLAFFALLVLTAADWVASRDAAFVVTHARVGVLLAACALLVGASSFPAYAKFRVKHMEQLYRLARRLETKQ